MASVTKLMKIEGLEPEPVEIEINSFSFFFPPGLLPKSDQKIYMKPSSDFHVIRYSDEFTPWMQGALSTGRKMQASITVIEQTPVVPRLLATYSFSDVSISNIQYSSATTGVVEDVTFHASETEFNMF